MELREYTGWRPHSMRIGRAKHEGDRGTKRSRVSKSRLDRALYKSAKGYKTARYAQLCKIVDSIHNIRR